MLQITIPAVDESELWDEVNEVFIQVPAMKEQTLQLEHSLISLSKWESKWCKPFISDKGTAKTIEENIDYVRCMTLNKNVDPRVYRCLTDDNIKKINEYIDAPMTATIIRERQQHSKINGDPITSELIYYWMIALNIPVEFEKWHLNRLITLIRICNIKNTPPKKRSTQEILKDNAALNAARRKKLHTKG